MHYSFASFADCVHIASHNNKVVVFSVRRGLRGLPESRHYSNIMYTVGLTVSFGREMNSTRVLPGLSTR